MSTAAPSHSRPRPHHLTAPRADQDLKSGSPPKALLVVAGAAISWAALIVGVAMASQYLAGMLQGHAWAFAIGIVSYIYLFIGFVLLLVRVISKESGPPAAP